MIWEFFSISLRAMSESSKICYFRTLLLIKMIGREPYLLLKNSSFTSEAQAMLNLGPKFIKIPKQNLKASFMSSTHALFSGKARCFSQPERALYGNFIINNVILSIHYYNQHRFLKGVRQTTWFIWIYGWSSQLYTQLKQLWN